MLLLLISILMKTFSKRQAMIFFHELDYSLFHFIIGLKLTLKADIEIIIKTFKDISKIQ